MAIANAESTLAQAVAFINGGPTVVSVYRPSSHEYETIAPIIHAVSRDDALAWLSGSDRPVAEKVSYVEKRADGSLRVVLDARYPVELLLSRATSPHHKKQCEDILKEIHGPHHTTGDVLDRTLRRDPWPVRDKEFYFSRWFRWDELLGVIVVGDEGINFLAVHEKTRIPMNKIAKHYEPYDWYTQENGLVLLNDLADNPTMVRSVTYPEFVKASNLEDAAALARNQAVGDFNRAGTEE